MYNIFNFYPMFIIQKFPNPPSPNFWMSPDFPTPYFPYSLLLPQYFIICSFNWKKKIGKLKKGGKRNGTELGISKPTKHCAGSSSSSRLLFSFSPLLFHRVRSSSPLLVFFPRLNWVCCSSSRVVIFSFCLRPWFLNEPVQSSFVISSACLLALSCSKPGAIFVLHRLLLSSSTSKPLIIHSGCVFVFIFVVLFVFCSCWSGGFVIR